MDAPKGDGVRSCEVPRRKTSTRFRDLPGAALGCCVIINGVAGTGDSEYSSKKGFCGPELVWIDVTALPMGSPNVDGSSITWPRQRIAGQTQQIKATQRMIVGFMVGWGWIAKQGNIGIMIALP